MRVRTKFRRGSNVHIDLNHGLPALILKEPNRNFGTLEKPTPTYEKRRLSSSLLRSGHDNIPALLLVVVVFFFLLDDSGQEPFFGRSLVFLCHKSPFLLLGDPSGMLDPCLVVSVLRLCDTGRDSERIGRLQGMCHRSSLGD